MCHVRLRIPSHIKMIMTECILGGPPRRRGIKDRASHFPRGTAYMCE